jgi:hypothetical protein
VEQKAPDNFVKDNGEGFLKECVTELSAGKINTGVLTNKNTLHSVYVKGSVQNVQIVKAKPRLGNYQQ